MRPVLTLARARLATTLPLRLPTINNHIRNATTTNSQTLIEAHARAVQAHITAHHSHESPYVQAFMLGMGRSGWQQGYLPGPEDLHTVQVVLDRDHTRAQAEAVVEAAGSLLKPFISSWEPETEAGEAWKLQNELVPFTVSSHVDENGDELFDSLESEMPLAAVQAVQEVVKVPGVVSVGVLWVRKDQKKK